VRSADRRDWGKKRAVRRAVRREVIRVKRTKVEKEAE
jgi:hypothetical protein